uniref:Uncharacterized protein n=1 Tax=Oryza punctata TaxID=4537 RepID=A0A0E0JXD3_ORYPU
MSGRCCQAVAVAGLPPQPGRYRRDTIASPPLPPEVRTPSPAASRHRRGEEAPAPPPAAAHHRRGGETPPPPPGTSRRG